MKIAVLILAHKNKGQLERLISAMQHSLVDIYIHLDKKSSLSPADFSHLDVRFTKNVLMYIHLLFLWLRPKWS